MCFSPFLGTQIPPSKHVLPLLPYNKTNGMLLWNVVFYYAIGYKQHCTYYSWHPKVSGYNSEVCFPAENSMHLAAK